VTPSLSRRALNQSCDAAQTLTFTVDFGDPQSGAHNTVVVPVTNNGGSYYAPPSATASHIYLRQNIYTGTVTVTADTGDTVVQTLPVTVTL
jgi:hypothetical protein